MGASLASGRSCRSTKRVNYAEMALDPSPRKKREKKEPKGRVSRSRAIQARAIQASNTYDRFANFMIY